MGCQVATCLEALGPTHGGPKWAVTISESGWLGYNGYTSYTTHVKYRDY